MNNKNNQTAIAKESRARRTKTGTYAVVLTVIVLAIIIVANVIMYSLPQKYTLFDTTKTEWTEISAQTENFVSLIDMPITIYVLCENGSIDFQYNTLLEKYSAANENIKIEKVDPYETPNFVSKYTDVALSNGSLIVESEKRFTVVDYGDMVYYSNPSYQDGAKISASAYQQMQASYYSQYGQPYPGFEAYFQAETLITSALDYVTIPTIPQVYMLQSKDKDNKNLYGEFSDSLIQGLASLSLEPKALDIKTDGTSIPEDASTIIIYAPKEDLTDGELAKLEVFIATGGDLILATDPTTTGFENLKKLCAIYGCSAEEGMLRDSDASHNNNNTGILKPDISTEHLITYGLLVNGMAVQMPNAHAISIAKELPENVAAMALFYTSKEGFRVSVEDDNTRLDESKAVYDIGVAATKKISNNSTSYFVWLGSTQMLTDDQAQSNGNYAAFAYGMRWASEIFSSAHSNIPGTNISGDYLDGLTLPAVIALGVIFVILIPAAVLISGFVIWFKRRRR